MNIKRFYKNEFPDQEDLIMAKVLNENDYGYNVVLLEYDNMEGFLPSGELVKKKYVKKHLLKINTVLPLVVLRVDENRRIVDLSKKRVTDKDNLQMLSKYKTCTTINRLLNECYTMHLKYNNVNPNNVTHQIEDLMDSTIWKFYDDIGENDENNKNDKIDSVYQNILENPKIILPNDLFTVDFIDKVNENIEKRITKTNTIIETELSLLILEENATSKIKEIFNTKNEINIDNYKIDIIIISPPHYKIRIDGNCNQKVNEIMELLKQKIIEKTNKYSCIIKFENSKIVSKLSYDIKFLGDFDLERTDLI